jgi:hypothetical protein
MIVPPHRSLDQCSLTRAMEFKVINVNYKDLNKSAEYQPRGIAVFQGYNILLLSSSSEGLGKVSLYK